MRIVSGVLGSFLGIRDDIADGMRTRFRVLVLWVNGSSGPLHEASTYATLGNKIMLLLTEIRICLSYFRKRGSWL